MEDLDELSPCGFAPFGVSLSLAIPAQNMFLDFQLAVALPCFTADGQRRYDLHVCTTRCTTLCVKPNIEMAQAHTDFIMLQILDRVIQSRYFPNMPWRPKHNDISS